MMNDDSAQSSERTQQRSVRDVFGDVEQVRVETDGTVHIDDSCPQAGLARKMRVQCVRRNNPLCERCDRVKETIDPPKPVSDVGLRQVGDLNPETGVWVSEKPRSLDRRVHVDDSCFRVGDNHTKCKAGTRFDDTLICANCDPERRYP